MLDNQVVHFRLAELATELEALRALVYRASELFLAGRIRPDNEPLERAGQASKPMAHWTTARPRPIWNTRAARAGERR